jgi:hypothetical protein
MTRLYFTDPTKALYMCIEFGVKFDTEVRISVDLSKYIYLRNMTPEIKKIYVVKESEHIFDPQKGDEGRWAGRLGGHYANYNGKMWVSHCGQPTPPPIIMRDNKQFFMAEIEDESRD